MLRSANEIRGYSLEAKDGSLGRVKDFLFNDEHWVIRYLVADTAKWLVGREVLLSPISLGDSDHLTQTLQVHLTKDQIKDSPPLAADKPVSRQYEVEFYRFYGWPAYWSGDYLWGPSPYPYELFSSPVEPPKEEPTTHAEGDPHLRSVKEVDGYRIQATDDDVGHIEDFIVDDKTWNIRYLIVDTRNWLPGRKVTISPQWIVMIDYGDSRVHIDLSRKEIEGSPEYDPATPINREYEIQLYDYYGRPRYW